MSDLSHDGDEVTFHVEGPNSSGTVRVWGDLPKSTPPPDASLAVALLPAMAAGGRLDVPGPLSPQLERSLPDIQAVLMKLSAENPGFPSLREVAVEARVGADPERPDTSRNGKSAAAFFSGGIDAWYTLLANPDLTDLVYVHGFDIPLEKPEASATVEARLAETARRRGKRLRVIRTNLRDLLDPIIPWEIAHGPVLAAVSLALSPDNHRVMIASSAGYADPAPRGSHPLHDHLWSTESCRIEHHGAHLNRAEKTARVAQCPEALETLRVCWREVDRYNCGACEKCLRTMVALAAVDALDSCPTFATDLDLEAVRSLEIEDPGHLDRWRENLDLARDHEADGELIGALEGLVSESRTHREHSPSTLAELEAAREGERSARDAVRAMENSRSWRLTRPLRSFGALARGGARRRGGA